MCTDNKLPSTDKYLLYKKLDFLDSMRGLMAINVIFCHFVIVYFPEMYYERFARESGGILSKFALTPLSVLINGDIAVRYFFVLTGFLVGRSVFTKKFTSEQVGRKCVNRYGRLFPVVMSATLFTYITMIFGLQYHLFILSNVPNSNVLIDYCNFTPTFKNLIFNIVIKPFRGGSDYVGPFWTIQFEFWGYMLSMVVCYLYKDSKWRRIGYIVIAGIVYVHLSENYIPFLMGIFVADVLYNQKDTILSRFYVSILSCRWFLVMCSVAGIYFASCPIYFSSIYKFWECIPHISTAILRSVGVTFLLFVLIKCPALWKPLLWKPIKLWGEVSYEVYAIHWPIMLSLQAWLFSVLITKWNYNVAACLAFIITVPVIYASALAMKWVILQVTSFIKYEIKKGQN